MVVSGVASKAALVPIKVAWPLPLGFHCQPISLSCAGNCAPLMVVSDMSDATQRMPLLASGERVLSSTVKPSTIRLASAISVWTLTV